MMLPTTAAEVSQTFYTYDATKDAALSAVVEDVNGDVCRTVERVILEACAPRFGGLTQTKALELGLSFPLLDELKARGYIKDQFDSPHGLYLLTTPLGLERWLEIMRAAFHNALDNPTGGV